MLSNYYKTKLPELVEKYKIAIDQCLEIIGNSIDDDLADDKLHNVLKAKRMAGEDVKFYAKEVENLENEINGVVAENEEETTPKSVLKKYTKK